MKSYPIVSRAALIATGLVVVAALLPGRTRAQVTSGANTTINTTSAGYLGILKLRCNCTLKVDPDERYRFFSFRSDPIIGSIERGSPADGVLATGDYITHVDGLGIQTSAGGQWFARIQPGQNVELTIRRSGKSSKVRLKAAALDWDDYRVLGTVAPEAVESGYSVTWETPTPPTTPGFPRSPRAPRAPRPSETPRAPRAPRAPVESRVWSDVTPFPAMPAEPAMPADPAIPALPAFPAEPAIPATPAVPPGFRSAWSVIVPGGPASPAGWFGFSFRCNDCGWSRPGREESPVWESGDSAPELSMIARGGPADRAGLRVGDRMTHIDGLSITTRAGARRLGAVKPGQTVRVTVIRDGKSLTRQLTLGTRPEARATVTPRAPGPPAPPRVRSELRYTGKLDDVSVEVWSHAGSNVERIGNTMVITVGTSVIRLKVDPKK